MGWNGEQVWGLLPKLPWLLDPEVEVGVGVQEMPVRVSRAILVPLRVHTCLIDGSATLSFSARGRNEWSEQRAPSQGYCLPKAECGDGVVIVSIDILEDSVGGSRGLLFERIGRDGLSSITR